MQEDFTLQLLTGAVTRPGMMLEASPAAPCEASNSGEMIAPRGLRLSRFGCTLSTNRLTIS